MQLQLRCGDIIEWRDGTAPICPVHGEQGVARTIGVPPPRIRGVATGPHVTTVDLGAFSGRLAGSAPKE
jgi:hypothetical protein